MFDKELQVHLEFKNHFHVTKFNFFEIRIIYILSNHSNKVFWLQNCKRCKKTLIKTKRSTARTSLVDFLFCFKTMSMTNTKGRFDPLRCCD